MTNIKLKGWINECDWIKLVIKNNTKNKSQGK